MASNIESKLLLAQKLIDHFPVLQKNFLQGKLNVNMSYHGVDLSLLISEQLSDEFKSLIPADWFFTNTTEHKILILTPDEVSADFVWDDLVDASCFDFKIENIKVVLQRDFLFIQNITENLSVVVCQTPLEKDGVFNFFRYYLPKKFLNSQKILIHSSCVVQNNQAYLFLGHSFAGKSTCATLCQNQGAKVLADDMNVATFSDDKIWIEGAALGQALQDTEFLGKKYELKNIFVLKKSLINKINQLSEVKQYRHLYSSFANVFTDDLETDEIFQIMSFSNKLISKLTISELEFNLNFLLDYIIERKSEEHFLI